MNKNMNHKQNQGAVIVGSSAVLGVMDESISITFRKIGNGITRTIPMLLLQLRNKIHNVFDGKLALWKSINHISVVGGVCMSSEPNCNEPMGQMADVLYETHVRFGKTLILLEIAEQAKMGNYRQGFIIIGNRKILIWEHHNRQNVMTPNDQKLSDGTATHSSKPTKETK